MVVGAISFARARDSAESKRSAFFPERNKCAVSLYLERKMVQGDESKFVNP
jgi:hypothetical protein